MGRGTLMLAALAAVLSCGRGAPAHWPGPDGASGGMMGDTLAIVPLPVPYRGGVEPGAERGLELRLREAPLPGTPGLPGSPATVRVDTLPVARSVELLARLTALPRAVDEPFRFPAASPPPPRTGRTVLAGFPAADTGRGAPEPERRALEVSRVVPEGATELAPHVTLTFNQPVVPLTTVAGAEAAAPPVRLVPQPAGRWLWLDPRTLRFQPEGRLPMATRFTVEVPAGTRAATGAVLEQVFRVEFETPAVRAVGGFPALPPGGARERFGRDMGGRWYEDGYEHASASRLDPVIVIAFDQRIDAAAVLRSTRLLADGVARPVRLARAEEVAADSLAQAIISTLQEGRFLALRPVTELPRAAEVRVVVEPGTASAEGPLTTVQPQALRFRTYGPLRVAAHECQGECEPGAPWMLHFTSPLQATSSPANLVSVEPALPEMSVAVWGAQLYIRGLARPHTQYRVTLSPALRDRFGQAVEGPRTFTFQTGAPRPLVMLPGSPMVVLDPAGPPRVAVRSNGLAQLRVRLYRVTPEQWPEWAAAVELAGRQRDGTLVPPGVLVRDERVQVAGRGVDFSETHIDVAPALVQGLGHAILLVDPVDAPTDPWRRQAALAWVQSTRIGVAGSADAEELFVWATGLESGEPVAGAEVVAVPTNRRATTAADGSARLPLFAAGDLAVIVRRGADAALLPASEHAFARGGGWTRRAQPTELRWYTFTDRGLYQPGETVRLKGWLRRMPASRTVSPVLAGDIASVAFRVTGPRQEQIASGTLRPTSLGGFHTTVELPEALNLGHAGIQLTAQGGPADEPNSSAWVGVQVQEFRRPDYEVGVSADPGPHIVGDVIDATLLAAYYGGGGLGGAAVEWRVRTQSTSYRPAGWPRWHFGRAQWWGPSAAREGEQTLEGVTDGTGAHRLRIETLAVDPPFTTSLRAEAQVQDVTRQVGSAGVDLLVHPAAVNVGLRTARSWVPRGAPVTIDIVVVDHDGRAVSGRAVDVSLVSRGDPWNAQPEAPATRAACRATSAAEPVSCTFTADSSGWHAVRADVRDEAGRVSRTELMIHVAGPAGPPRVHGEANRFELLADRAEYQPGDTAVILLQPPFVPAEAHITVRGAGMLATHRVRIDRTAYEWRLPITEAHISGVSVRSDVVDANDGVRYAFGETEISVPPHRRGLGVRVLPRDSVAAPGAETVVEVEVRDAAGRLLRDAEVAVWMVDEAVLALGGYALADPLQVFYAPRRAFVQDQHTRRWVVVWPRSAGPGTLSGVVLGESGQALTGAVVRVAGTDAETTTAFDGSFTLRGLRAGEHVLEVTAADGRSARRTVTVPPEGAHVGNMVLGATGLVVAEEHAADAVMQRAVAVAPLPPPPAAPPPPTAVAMDAMVVTGKAAAPDVDVRMDFAPLAFFEPALRTDAQGRVRVRARLPESLTRYRVMAAAVGGAELFGTGEATVTARKDLVVRVLAPRFLHQGDRFELPVLVQNTGNAVLPVQVAARAAGVEMNAAGRSFTLRPGERVEVRFAGTAPRAGSAQVQAIAVAGTRTDAAAATIPVLTPATVEAFALHGSVAEGGPVVLPFARPRGVIEQFGGLDVTLSSTALQSLTDAVLYLHTYPFTGTEHIASRVLAVAALRDVLTAFAAEGLPSTAELVAATQRDIADLVARQMDDGGWAFWRGGLLTDPFVSMHAAHALQRARERGFDVSPDALQRAARYLRNVDQHLGRWPQHARQSANAYAVYVRHHIGDEMAVQDARRQAAAVPATVGGELPIEARAWLLAVLAGDAASRGQADALRRGIMNRLVETAGTATFAEQYDDGTHLLLHSRRRTDAVVLEALIATNGDSDVVTKLASSLLAHRTAGRWAGTQENAWVLLALDRYFRTYEAVAPAFDARVWLGERLAGSHAFRGRTTERSHIAVPMTELLRSSAEEIVMAREGQGRMYYRAALRYAPADPRVPATDRGFGITRSYEAIDDPADVTRDADGTWIVRAGARVRVSLTMVAPSRRYHVALIDPLPAGFEAVNPALQGTGFADEPAPAPQRPTGRPAPPIQPPTWRGTWYDHQNMRDDRVEAFAALLSAGTWEYSYIARATTPGRFTAPPPRAEMMYEPETFGRAEGGVVVIR